MMRKNAKTTKDISENGVKNKAKSSVEKEKVKLESNHSVYRKRGRAKPYSMEKERQYKSAWRKNKETPEGSGSSPAVVKLDKPGLDTQEIGSVAKKNIPEFSFVGYQLHDDLNIDYKIAEKKNAFIKLCKEAQALWDSLVPTLDPNIKLNEAKALVAIKLMKKYKKKYTSVNLFAKAINMSCHLLRYYILHPERASEQKERRAMIAKIAQEFPDYGKRRITQELNNRGYFYSVVTVSRDMDILGLKHETPHRKKEEEQGIEAKNVSESVETSTKATKSKSKAKVAKKADSDLAEPASSPAKVAKATKEPKNTAKAGTKVVKATKKEPQAPVATEEVKPKATAKADPEVKDSSTKVKQTRTKKKAKADVFDNDQLETREILALQIAKAEQEKAARALKASLDAKKTEAKATKKAAPKATKKVVKEVAPPPAPIAPVEPAPAKVTKAKTTKYTKATKAKAEVVEQVEAPKVEKTTKVSKVAEKPKAKATAKTKEVKEVVTKEPTKVKEPAKATKAVKEAKASAKATKAKAEPEAETKVVKARKTTTKAKATTTKKTSK